MKTINDAILRDTGKVALAGLKLGFNKFSLCRMFQSIVSGMALGFFNLGPGTHISGQTGVPSILGGS